MEGAEFERGHSLHYFDTPPGYFDIHLSPFRDNSSSHFFFQHLLRVQLTLRILRQ